MASKKVPILSFVMLATIWVLLSAFPRTDPIVRPLFGLLFYAVDAKATKTTTEDPSNKPAEPNTGMTGLIIGLSLIVLILVLTIIAVFVKGLDSTIQKLYFPASLISSICCIIAPYPLMLFGVKLLPEFDLLTTVCVLFSMLPWYQWLFALLFAVDWVKKFVAKYMKDEQTKESDKRRLGKAHGNMTLQWLKERLVNFDFTLDDASEGTILDLLNQISVTNRIRNEDVVGSVTALLVERNMEKLTLMLVKDYANSVTRCQKQEPASREDLDLRFELAERRLCRLEKALGRVEKDLGRVEKALGRVEKAVGARGFSMEDDVHKDANVSANDNERNSAVDDGMVRDDKKNYEATVDLKKEHKQSEVDRLVSENTSAKVEEDNVLEEEDKDDEVETSDQDKHVLANAIDAEDAIHDLNPKELCGPQVAVEASNRGSGSHGGISDGEPSYQRSRSFDRAETSRFPPSRKTKYCLIVENLSSRCSGQDLKDMVRNTAEATYADAHKEKMNTALLCFESHSDLKRAMNKYQGEEINGRKIKLIDDTCGSGRSGSRSPSTPRTRRRRSCSRFRSPLRVRHSFSGSRSRSPLIRDKSGSCSPNSDRR
uniref:RRM domain-containing protein n=1 Tax=Ditylenchus dipsaci TaxID=166011 RepID=A0A915ES62_9BILA